MADKDRAAYKLAWEEENPDKARDRRKRYRDKFRPGATNSKKPWTAANIQRIMAKDRPSDTVLAKQLHRTVQAIQGKRHKLLAEEKKKRRGS